MPVHITWKLHRELPTYVKGGAMGLVGGAPVYACGMTQPWRETELSWWWDEGQGAWRPVEPCIPLGRCYTHGADLQDGLLVLGGRRSTPAGRQSLRDAWWLQRPGETFTWTRLPDMHCGRAIPAVGTCEDLVLALGGGEWEKSQGGAFATRHLQNYELLDLGNMRAGWRDMGPLPFPSLVGSAFASADGCFYVFGGYECWTEGETRRIARHASAWKYEFASDRWSRLADCPVAGSGWCAAARGRTIFLLGGAYPCGPEDSTHSHTFHTLDAGTSRQRLIGAYSDRVFTYAIDSDTYRLLPERMPVGLNDLRCALRGDTLWAAGGETVDPALSNTLNAVMVGTIASDLEKPQR